MAEDTIRVLLVDDDEDEYVLTRDLLAEMRGYRVDLAWVGTYEAGLEALGRDAYDAALVDYRLGARTGLDLMRAAAAEGGATPIILLTGQGDRAVDVAAMEAGAADYVVKGQGDAATLERALRYAITQARLRETLRASEARFRRMVATAQEGVVVRDLAGLLTYVNARMAEMLGYRAEEMIGRPLVAFMDEEMRAAAEAGFRRRAAGLAERFDFRFRRQDGAPLWTIVSTSPLLDERGAFVESLGMVTDITARKQAEDASRASEASLAEAQRLAHVGDWWRDAATGEAHWSAELYRIHGIAPGEADLGERLPALTHPEDRAAVTAWMGEVLAGTASRTEHRIVRPDGVVRHVHQRTDVVRDERGRPRRLVGVVQDITERVRAAEELRASEGLFRAVWEHANDSMVILNPEGAYRYVSPSHVRLLGRTHEEILGGAPTAHMHPDDRTWAGPRLAALLRTPGAVDTVEVRMRHEDGSWRWVESVAANHMDDPAVRGTIIHSRDITERKRAADALRASERDHRALMEQAADAIFVLDPAGRFLDVNARACALLGYGRDELLQFSIPDVMDRADLAATPVRFAEIRAGTTVVNERRMRRKDGAIVPVEISAKALADGRMQAIARDITERKRAEEVLRHQARYDALTDLPNRTLLHERVAAALGDAPGIPQPLALLLLDLDHFKEVNDTFGHEQGDGLLCQVAARLRVGVRVGDTVARLGGDEFAVLLPGADAAGAARVAADIRAALDAPLHVEGQVLRVGASVGIALGPAHGADGTTLLRHADVAMYAAKRARTGYALYDPAQDQHSPERLALVGELRAEIEGGALTLHYQPQVDLASGRVCGVEALVRWPHPRRGLIPPDHFIPLAEQTGLIALLTEWVLAEAVRQGRAWQRGGLLLGVSVNLSMWNLHDPALPARVASLLQEQGLPPAWLRLELTEGALMADPERALDVLTRLAGLGVRLAVDDFGAGYSSLAYLKTLPVDELKIDKSFVRAMATDAADAAIVASTVALGHALGLRVVAEGIEDRATWDLLAEMGCDVAQGYHIARPLPPDALADWLRAAPWAVA